MLKIAYAVYSLIRFGAIIVVKMEAVKGREEMKKFEVLYAEMKKNWRVKPKYLKRQFCRRLEAGA